MDRPYAYDLAERSLRPFQKLTFSQLAGLVGGPPVTSRLSRNDGEYAVSVTVQWVGEALGPVGVEAVVEGPSTWRLERLRESFVAKPEGE